MRALTVLLRFTWTAARLPVLACLIVFEPLVSVVLSWTCVLGALMALFFEYLIALPEFPFREMLQISLGAAMLQLLYQGTIRLFCG